MEKFISYFPLTHLAFDYAVLFSCILHSIVFEECKYLPLSGNMGFTVLPHVMIATSFFSSYCSLLCNAFIFDEFQIAQVKTPEGEQSVDIQCYHWWSFQTQWVQTGLQYSLTRKVWWHWNPKSWISVSSSDGLKNCVSVCWGMWIVFKWLKSTAEEGVKLYSYFPLIYLNVIVNVQTSGVWEKLFH